MTTNMNTNMNEDDDNKRQQRILLQGGQWWNIGRDAMLGVDMDSDRKKQAVTMVSSDF